MNIMDSIRQQQLRKDAPDFKVGDTVRVGVVVREGDKTRTQMFEGVVIDRHGSYVEATFTVRKISAGVAVERVFPVHSPSVASIELVRSGRVRRARLNYLRGRSGKGARIAERQEGLELAAGEGAPDDAGLTGGTGEGQPPAEKPQG